MLIKRVVLERIVDGEIELIFRKWRKPTVKAGGQLRTSVGMLNIVAIDKVTKASVTTDEARRAGFPSKAALGRELDGRSDGDIYRIAVEPGGTDPRIALQKNADLTHDELSVLEGRLARLDSASKRGPWTRTFLELIDANQRVRAPDLAAELGLDKSTFKNEVRKLKGLGLTISFSPGYELSPRGKAYLDRLG